jgi:DNA-binding MarR family transcriptional regulator
MDLAGERRGRIINDFLASMQIFSSAINDLMSDQLRQNLGGDLTVSQLKMLKLIAATEPDTISEVASFLRVSNAAASKAVDRLVRRNLINRTGSSDDRRMMRLSLTPEGKDVVVHFEAAQNRLLEGLFREFTSEDFVHTAELLDQLSANIIDQPAGPESLCFRCGIYFREKCLIGKGSGQTCYYHLHSRKKKSGIAGPNNKSDNQD